MLSCALVLQATVLLPVPPLVPPGGGDPSYRDRCEEICVQAEWPETSLRALRPSTPAQERVLGDLLRYGGPRHVKLASYLAADCAADSPLAPLLLRAACETPDPAASMAALLAPAALPAELLPATAVLALDRRRSLGFRAAACSRLLESGCLGAWPLARSILRSGTSLDEDAPWADWRRDGRYELPKRLLSLCLDRLFAARGLPPSGFEANASWADQERSLAELETRVPDLLRSSKAAGEEPTPAFAQAIATMLRHGAAGDERMLRALALLSPRALPVLRLALGRSEAGLRIAAQRTLERIPR